jgi:hypothetical protein
MGILMSNEIKQQLTKEIHESTQSIQVITAFCKEAGIEYLEECNINKVSEKKLLVRMTMEDILSGATDLSVYDFCRKHAWKMYMRFDLHAKTYIFDNKRCILGSANLTNRGLLIKNGGNLEIAGLCEMSDEDMEKVNSLFVHAIELNDTIYDKMTGAIEKVNQSKKISHVWPGEIIDLFRPDVSVLFTYDFPDYDSYYEYKNDEIAFLGLPAGWNINILKESFMYCKAYRWLKDELSKNDGQLYFGEATEKLHSIIVNDPRPYRKEVKELLARVLKWIQDLEIEEVVIDRPNYSQRIRLKSC